MDSLSSIDKYNWLAERNGIAVASLNLQFEFIFNSHAMLIFGIDKSCVNLENLRKTISDFDLFKRYLEKITNETSEYHLTILSNNTKKNYLVYGIKDNSEYSNLTIQALDTDHNNAEYLCQYAIHSSDVFAIWNTENQLLYLSQNFEGFFKRNRADLKGEISPIFDWVLHKESLKHSALHSAEQDIITEFKILMPDKSIKWVSYQKKTLYDNDGTIFRHLSIFTDITKRKEDESKYKMIVEGQNEQIVKLDKAGNILFASPSFEKGFKKTKQDILGHNFLDYVHKSEKDVVSIAMEKMLKPPYTSFFEFDAQTNAGMRWFAWNFTGVSDNDGQISKFIGVGRDITYQKMVESALRESEDRFRSIVQNLSDVVFLIDEKANIKYVTPSCEQYLGITVEELLGFNILNLIHGDDKWLAEENIELHIEGANYSMPYEIRLKHKSNIWKVFEAKSQSLLNHTAVNSIIITISDITERKLMEKQVLDAIIKTEEKERGRFAKDLHDDLGPLLSSIKMYIGMLKKVDNKEKQDFILTNLQEIVKEAIVTTKDVSNDLNPHVLNNYGLISALKIFIDKLSKELNIEFIEEIGDTRYSTAIELSLYRITKELINNTIKHAEASQIKILIKENAGDLNLLFEDNGKGITEGAFKVKQPGGMGLSNIISRAKSLNARHTFHTNLTNGFKFEIHVPLVQE